jgi:type I restriction enzyme S subunit
MVGELALSKDVQVDFAAARRGRVTPSERTAYGLRDGDILVTRVFAVVEGVGRSVLVSDLPEPAVYESNMMRLRVGGRVLPKWLFLAMKQPLARRHIEANANASNQTSINQVGLNSLLCPVPPVEEQGEALVRIGVLEKRLNGEEAALTKLRLLKKGLSDDLLTGRVRVAVPKKATQ